MAVINNTTIVGTINSAGNSNAFARADHRIRLGDNVSFTMTELHYREAVKEVFQELFAGCNVHSLDTYDVRARLSSEQLKDERIGTAYLKRVLTMSTESLNFIVDEHKNGNQLRTPTTVDAIMSELFERKLKSETREY